VNDVFVISHSEIKSEFNVPWCSLLVHGVEDAPVSWLLPSSFAPPPPPPVSAASAHASSSSMAVSANDDEATSSHAASASKSKSEPPRKPHFHHDFLFSGDNSYSYVLLAEQQYWLYTALGPLDECS
jgi:hypothetical protein